MATEKKPTGGQRDGAGRKPSNNPKKSHTIRATDSQWKTFQEQGGNAWLSKLLDSLKNNKN
jgi:hypothetical protein